MALLDVRALRKGFASPEGGRTVVVDVERFTLGAGEQVGLRGRSGSGKTTFLNLLSGLLRPDSGQVFFDGVEVSALPESARDRLRAQSIGTIFQSFNLLQGLTALENVLIGMHFGHGARRAAAQEALVRVGLGERLGHFPRQLSVGQQQRVAIARALASGPRLVLADEPTGNLDPETGTAVMDLIRSTCAERGAALLVVSHDPGLLARLPRVVDFADLRAQEAIG